MMTKEEMPACPVATTVHGGLTSYEEIWRVSARKC